MFFYTRQCEQGHRLGDSVMYDGKKQDVTATVNGKPRLQELSVVGAGAVPDAKDHQTAWRDAKRRRNTPSMTYILFLKSTDSTFHALNGTG